jgi:hypothetical protein
MVQNLVQLSFVENVGPFVGDAATFNETWPTALRREAERQRGEARRPWACQRVRLVHTYRSALA